MLFQKEYKEAEEKLHSKGYYIDNMMAPYDDCYEISDETGKIMIDYLSLAQVIQLSNMIADKFPE